MIFYIMQIKFLIPIYYIFGSKQLVFLQFIPLKITRPWSHAVHCDIFNSFLILSVCPLVFYILTVAALFSLHGLQTDVAAAARHLEHVTFYEARKTSPDNEEKEKQIS